MAYRGRRGVAALAAVAIAAGVGVGYLGTRPANAEFAPRSGPVFNNPKGTPDRQYAIMRQIERNIDTSPPGSVIRVAVYSITLEQFADKLIAAHRRGVHVRVLIDQHSVNDIWRRLSAELGTKVDLKSSASSYAAVCSGGCVGHYYKDGKPTSSLHSKNYLFSGGGKPTVVISSANPTPTQAYVAFNHSYSVVGNKELYKAYVRNFNDMSRGAKGVIDRDYYWTSGTNPKAYFWPKAKPGSDTILGMLKLVTCSRTYPSQVRVAMFQWTDARVAVARQLASMASKGCKVTVAYTRALAAPSIRSALAGSRVDVRDTAHGRNGDGYAEHYTHSKYLLIDGRYNGVNGAKIVMAGSANLSANSLYRNDESNMKVVNSTVYQAFLRNFNAQIAAVPATVAQQRGRGQLPAIPIDPAEALDS